MKYNLDNFLIITLDSCRWDTYLKAKTPNLDSLLKLKKAYSQGTYTLPSHLSIYSGILPSVWEEIPLYNRFKKDLFRVDIRPVLNEPYIMFPKDTYNIITGLKKKGYNSYGTGAVGWFRHPLLNQYFDKFLYSGINLEKQVNFLLSCLNSNEEPFFALLNIGETHEPYEYGGEIKETGVARNRMRAFSNIGYLDKEHGKQIACLEFIDYHLNIFFNKLVKRTNLPTTIIICGDHGECFGEDGFYGHGFFHEKVMEVPLGIFKL